MTFRSILLGAALAGLVLPRAAAAGVRLDTRTALATGPGANGARVIEVAPAASWRSRMASWRTTLGYRPSVAVATLENTRVRHRGDLTVARAPRARLRPAVSGAFDLGEARAAEDPGDPERGLESRPGPRSLRAYAVRLRTALDADVTPRASLSLAVSGERSGGTGPDAARLPLLTRLSWSMAGAYRLSQVESIESHLSVSKEADADGASRSLTRAWLGHSRRVTRQRTLGWALGFARGDRGPGARPGWIARVSLEEAASKRSWPRTAGLAVALQPSYDRIDRTLRQRVEGAAQATFVLGPSWSGRTRFQWASDVSSESALSRQLALDVAVQRSFGRSGALEAGLRVWRQTDHEARARYVQDDARVFVSWTHTWSAE